MGAALFFRSLEPNFIFTWLTAKEDFIAYVSCESFKFGTIFLPVKFCVRKGKGTYQSCVLCKYEYCYFEVGYFGVSVLQEWRENIDRSPHHLFWLGDANWNE